MIEDGKATYSLDRDQRSVSMFMKQIKTQFIELSYKRFVAIEAFWTVTCIGSRRASTLQPYYVQDRLYVRW